MCFGDLLLLLWMWGASIHVWRLHGIGETIYSPKLLTALTPPKQSIYGCWASRALSWSVSAYLSVWYDHHSRCLQC